MTKWAVLVLALVALFAGKAWGEAGEPTEVVKTVVRTVAPAEYTELLSELGVADASGIRARLEGVRTVQPEVIVRTDTLIQAPDTVLRFFTIDSRGRLHLEVLHQHADSIDLYTPEIQSTEPLGDCDDGLSFQDGEIRCDPARLGHLYVGPHLSRDPALSAWWTPSYRSPWEASVSYDGDRFDFGLRRGVRIF